jgi:hypothetical protein
MSGKGGERGGCHGRIVILFFIEFTPAILFFIEFTPEIKKQIFKTIYIYIYIYIYQSKV